MLIGYDFWGDFYNNDSTQEKPLIIEDNDGIVFDTCNPLAKANEFTLTSGEFDELHITKDGIDIDNNIEKTEWTLNTVLLAKFQDNLIAGTIGIDGKSIDEIELRRRKKGEDVFQTYFVVKFNELAQIYTVVDKLIENETDYEYCIRGVTYDDGVTNYSNDSLPAEIHISYEHAHLFDSENNFDLIYNVRMDTVTNQMGANVIETLSSQYPYVIYGQSNYLKGSMECLLVSEESATGMVNIQSEKELRKKILAFLTNKQSKVFKNEDGLYMLIEIVGTPTLTPSNDIIGIYQVNFEYVEIGNVDNIQDLQNGNITFDYFTYFTDKTEKQTNLIG